MLIDFVRDVRRKLTSEGALMAYAVMLAVTCGVVAACLSSATNNTPPSTVAGFAILAGFFFLWSVVKSFTHATDNYEPSDGVRLFELGFFSLLKAAAVVALVMFALPSPYLEGWLFWGGFAALFFWRACAGFGVFVMIVTAMVRDKVESVRWNQAVIRERLRQIQAESDAKRQATAQTEAENSLLSDLADYLSEDRDKK